MKLTYKAERNLSVIIIILANILSDVFQHWIYISVGWGIIGLMFIVHPVVPDKFEGNEKAIFWVRIAGVIAILIGVFTRVHY